MTQPEIKYIGDICYIYRMSKAELISTVTGKKIPLSATEYTILCYFVEHIDRPVSLEELAKVLWKDHYDEKDPNSLKSQISRIRGKLEKMCKGLGSCIDTNFGFNSYTLRLPEGQYRGSTPTAPASKPEVPSSVAAPSILAPSLDRSMLSVRPANYYDLLDLGYTSRTIAESLVTNDLSLYGSVLSPENEGEVKQWEEYLSSVPDSFQYLLNANNEIVGNFSFLSISEEQEAAFVEGLISESAFTPDSTRDLFCSGDDHILFLLNLSLNDRYSTPKNNTLLRRMFLEQLVLFAQEEIRFRKIIVNVFKSSHEAFYKQWGFTFVKQHKYSGRIYELDLLPYPESLAIELSKNQKLHGLNEQLKELYGK